MFPCLFIRSNIFHVRHLSLYSSEELKALCVLVEKELFCIKKKELKLNNTRKQSDCTLWYEVRHKIITGSKCSQILK